MTDPLGPTGNTASECRYCGVAHEPCLTACSHDRLRRRIDELQRRIDLMRKFANLYTKCDDGITSYLVTIPYHDWLEAIGDQP